MGINTEMGVLIDSPELARTLVENLDSRMQETAYHVVLRDGKTRWVRDSAGQELVLDREPDTSWWERFSAGFMRILPIREQL